MLRCSPYMLFNMTTFGHTCPATLGSQLMELGFFSSSQCLSLHQWLPHQKSQIYVDFLKSLVYICLIVFAFYNLKALYFKYSEDRDHSGTLQATNGVELFIEREKKIFIHSRSLARCHPFTTTVLADTTIKKTTQVSAFIGFAVNKRAETVQPQAEKGAVKKAPGRKDVVGISPRFQLQRGSFGKRPLC